MAVVGGPSTAVIVAPQSPNTVVVDTVTQAVIVRPEETTVIVSPAGMPGPRGPGYRLLGRLPANTTPGQFPTSPAPRDGDSWIVGGVLMYIWDASTSTWIEGFEIPDGIPTYVQSFPLPVGSTSVTFTVTHNFHTRDVFVETRLLPSNTLIDVGATATSIDVVSVTISSLRAWDDTHLRVQVRP